MAKVEIYTTQICPYCVRAKDLLTRKGVTFTEIYVDNDEALRAKMMERAGGRRSVPQIFINDQHIGGSDDLYALEQAKKLDALLK
jgi:glutaredoxin 3